MSDERDEQKADAVDLRLNDEEDPVERVEREPDGEGGGDLARESVKRTALRLREWLVGLGHHVRNKRPAMPTVQPSIEPVSVFIYWPSARRST